MVLVFTNMWPMWVSTIFYCLSAITLTYAVYIFVIYFRKIKNSIRELLHRNRFTKRLLTDYEYRTLFFSRCSFFINFAYATFTIILGVVIRSVWYFSLAIYYFILSIMRYIITRTGNKLTKLDIKHHEDLSSKKSKIYLATGISMFVLDYAMLTPIILMLINRKQNVIMLDWFAIMIAAYTFYKLSVAIYNIFKASKSKDRVIQSLRNINLSDAIMSTLSLQISLVTVFGEGNNSMYWMNVASGIAVPVLVGVIGILMIVKASKELKNKKKEKNNEQKI